MNAENADKTGIRATCAIRIIFIHRGLTGLSLASLTCLQYSSLAKSTYGDRSRGFSRVNHHMWTGWSLHSRNARVQLQYRIDRTRRQWRWSETAKITGPGAQAVLAAWDTSLPRPAAASTTPTTAGRSGAASTVVPAEPPGGIGTIPTTFCLVPPLVHRTNPRRQMFLSSGGRNLQPLWSRRTVERFAGIHYHPQVC